MLQSTNRFLNSLLGYSYQAILGLSFWNYEREQNICATEAIPCHFSCLCLSLVQLVSIITKLILFIIKTHFLFIVACAK